MTKEVDLNMKQNENIIHGRNEILEILSIEIDILNKKIQSGRIANPENEKIKINQHRALIYGCNTYNSILKDNQLDDLAKELKNIKLSLLDKDYSEKDLNEELELVESILETLEIKT